MKTRLSALVLELEPINLICSESFFYHELGTINRLQLNVELRPFFPNCGRFNLSIIV